MMEYKRTQRMGGLNLMWADCEDLWRERKL